MKSGAVVLFILVVVLGFSMYYFYTNLPVGEGTEFVEIGGIVEEGLGYESSQQFYQNMRFPERRISYNVQSACGEVKRLQVERAFEFLEEQTVLEFYSRNNDAEISIVCSELAPEPENREHFVAGEGGPTEIISTPLYAVILSGEISLFRDEKCDEPKIAIHEILHVLGFDHNNNPQSILYPTLNCAQTIDGEIINEINILYEPIGKADMKFGSVEATKNGRYLNFRAEIINQGLKEARGSELEIYADGEIVEFSGGKESISLGEIGIGSTKILTVENVRIPRNTKKIEFVIDRENVVDEIFEDNNKIELIIEGD